MYLPYRKGRQLFCSFVDADLVTVVQPAAAAVATPQGNAREIKSIASLLLQRSQLPLSEPVAAPSSVVDTERISSTAGPARSLVTPSQPPLFSGHPSASMPQPDEPADQAPTLSSTPPPEPTTTVTTAPAAEPARLDNLLVEPVAPVLRDYVRPLPSVPAPTPVAARSLDEAFSWPRHFYENVRRSFPDGVLLDLKERFSIADRTSAYSGLDAMGVACNQLTHVLGQILGGAPLDPMPLRACTEWDPYLQAEILDGPHAPEHQYGDVKTFWAPGVLQTLANFEKRGIAVPLSALMSTIKAPGSVSTTAWCHIHKKPCTHPRATFHQGSPACTDVSPFGQRSGVEGTTMQDFAAWCALRLVLKDVRAF
jgi:hypothetical protein